MRFLLMAAAMLLVSGCGSEDVPPEPGDGFIRPAPNGVRVTEALACDAYAAGISKTMLSVGCAGTTRTCPGLLQAQQGGAMCLEYDQGSLQGCIDHIKSRTTCQDIAIAVDACIVYAYADSAPAGCP